MYTRLKPQRVKASNTPQPGQGLGYINPENFEWKDIVGDMKYADFEWKTLTGNSVVIQDIDNNITPASNFTVSAGTVKPGIEYVLRVNTGSTAYTMTLGTGIQNPNSYSTELKPNTINQFKFIALTNSTLELEGIAAVQWGEIEGLLENQTDLQYALNQKADDNTVVKLTGNQTVNGVKTFGSEPVLPSKTTAATNSGTKPATEAQVYLKADDDKVVHKAGAETITGVKTFQAEPVLPSKSTAAGNNPTKPATEKQVYDVKQDLNTLDSNVVKTSGDQTVNGTKTFGTSPVVPSKTTDATNTGTAIATEAQVYKKANKVASATADNLASLTSAGDLADSGIAKSTVELNTNKETGDAPTDSTTKYPSSHTVKKYVDDQVSAATAGAVSDAAYGSSWNGVTGIAPSKNAVYDKIKSVDGKISTINGKIPSAASTSNQLADKAFVNSSINSVTAYYITKNAAGDQFATYAELAAATTFYSGGEVRVPTRNDYCIVQSDENHDNATTRYIYNNGWEYQYTINETPLTQAQLDALNSGITSGKVSTYDAYATNKQDKLVSGTNIKTINNTSILGSGNIDTNQVSDAAYGSGWDGVTGTAPSKNAVYDKINAMDTTISNKADASKIIKVFEISGTSDTTNAQAAVNWFRNGGVPVILYSQSYHYLANNVPLEYQSNPTLQFINTDADYATMNTIEIWTSNYTVSTINIRGNNFVKSVGGSSGAVSLKTVNNNSLVGSGNIVIDAVIKSATQPTTATEGDLWYNTTDDKLRSYNGSSWDIVGDGDVKYSDFNWQTKSGATVTMDLACTITPTANFTVNAPATIKDGQSYILRVNNGSTAYTMTLGTGITNPYGTDLTLTAGGVDQFLFLAIGGNLELQPEGGGGGNTSHESTTITLTSAGWSSKEQTVNATGVTADNTVFVSPHPDSINDYASCSIYCAEQGSGTLKFKCNTVPSGNIDVNVVILN